MILPRLRANLNITPSPSADRPGVVMRDPYHYAKGVLVIPPLLERGLKFFDGARTDADLSAEFSRLTQHPDMSGPARHLIETLDQAGFLENATYAALRDSRHRAFAASPLREAALAGSAYPKDKEPLRDMLATYLEGAPVPQDNIVGIAAPHVSLAGGWRCFRDAYQALTPDLRDRTFVVLGTSHFGPPQKFGLTRKPFRTPFGTTTTADLLVNELGIQPAAVMEDYCHAVEHSIELQIIFLQAIYGPDIRVLPILCGSLGHIIQQGKRPEDDEAVKRFYGALGDIAAREGNRLLWVLGVDLAHMGARYGDAFAAHAYQDEMATVKERDSLRLGRIAAGDAQGFWDLIHGNRDDLKWCGSSPFYTFLKAVPQARGILRRYEQWNIDDKSVVSYVGMSFASA